MPWQICKKNITWILKKQCLTVWTVMTWLTGWLLFTRQWKEDLPKRHKTLTTSFPEQENHLHCHIKFYKTYHCFGVTKNWDNKHLQTLTVWFYMMWHCSLAGKYQHFRGICCFNITAENYDGGNMYLRSTGSASQLHYDTVSQVITICTLITVKTANLR
jgi:hypothetical protein